MLKLYRLTSESASYGDTKTAVVWAKDEDDACMVLAEAFVHGDGPGYLAAPANPYTVEEVPRARGLVLAEGQDG